MGVDHGRPHAPVAEKLLNGADVVAVLQQMGGERVAEGMAGGALCDVALADSLANRLLDGRRVQVVAYFFPRFLPYALTRWKDVLPTPVAGCLWELPGERIGEARPTVPGIEIPPVDSAHLLQVVKERGLELFRKHGQPALPPLSVVHGYLTVIEVEVFHPEAEALVQPQSGTVEKQHHEAGGSGADFWLIGEQTRLQSLAEFAGSEVSGVLMSGRSVVSCRRGELQRKRLTRSPYAL